MDYIIGRMCFLCEKNEIWIDGDKEYPMCYSCQKKAQKDAFERFNKIYGQPERSKREDSQKCEMRCSEHCGNTVRDK